MVDNYFVYNRIRDLSKTGTSGYQSLEQYNGDAKQVTNELARVLSNNYEDNGAVADALVHLLKTVNNAVVSGGGAVTLPEDYLHLDSMGTVIAGEKVPFNKIMRKEVDTIMSSGVRKFNVAKKNLGYYKDAGGIQLLPEQSFPLIFRYIRKPADPVLSLVLADDGDYEIIDPNPINTKNFEFGDSVTDLIIYMMLEKLGVQMKEQIVTEYANIGIQRANIKPPTA